MKLFISSELHFEYQLSAVMWKHLKKWEAMNWQINEEYTGEFEGRKGRENDLIIVIQY